VRVRAGDDELHVTALPLTDVDNTISRLITVEVVATLLIVAVLAAVTWWVIRLGIRPIKRMTRTATAIAAGERDLSQRVPTMAPSTEAGQLGLALNHMLETLETAFAERTESQERLRRFVADASHELRTPVTTIRGYAELYRMGGLAAPGELDEAMRRTEQEAVRMARLVDDLLALAKFDEGRPLDRRPIDLTALVADAARDARAVDPERLITTELDGPIVVLGDEDRLRQVLANVVGNALVHTPPGAPIELATTTADGGARVRVTDHGPGMAPEVAARVTERFYRADRARARDRGGSGLGLAIADAAVIAHGGTITVDSVLGVGTTVTVMLPLAR
jgi:two-component system OmpR family sensor kinase